MPGAIVQSTVNPSAPPGILFAGDAGVPRGIAQTRKSHFSPRIGVAWDLMGDGKTSIRAGAGIFYGSLSGNQWNTTANFEPFATRLTFPNGGSVTGATLSDPYHNFPGGIPFPYNGRFVSGATIFGLSHHYTYRNDYGCQRAVSTALHDLLCLEPGCCSFWTDSADAF